jgi:YesN/AraC family two-component response regulator
MKMEERVRILIADDRPRSRKGLAALLSINKQIEIIGEAKDGREAVEFVEKFSPDVVLMDAKMPGTDGIAATREIKQRWPGVRVVVLSMYQAYEKDAQDVGADRFLEKGCEPRDLVRAILDV